MRKRKVIKRGENSYAISLLKADIDDFELKEGSKVDIEDISVVEEKEWNKKK